MTKLPIDDEGTVHALVDHLGYDLDPSILIGGWATFERVGGEISKDIDLIIASDEVRAKIQDRVTDLSSSTHHQGKKWRGSIEGVHVDIYIPYESQLGNALRLKVEVLAQYTEEETHNKWKLLTLEAHIVTKFAALLDRPDTVKGEKDARELLRLLRLEPDSEQACRILIAATDAPVQSIPDQVDRAFRLIAELASESKKDRRWLESLRREWVDDARRLLVATPATRPASPF